MINSIRLKNILFISVLLIINPNFTLYPGGLSVDISFNFKNIGLEQGLSQSTVYSIAQDKQGFMWFGTADGLNRYDGYTIKVFKHDPADSNSLSDDRVNSLLTDSKGNLWIGTSHGGVDMFTLGQNIFYHYVHNDKNKQSISDNRITSLFKDSRNNIWIGTRNGLNLYIPDINYFKQIYFNSRDTSTLKSNSINTICEDKDNNLWVGTSKGLFRINLDNPDKYEKYNNINSNINTPYGDDVTSLYIDRIGNLWVGTYNQVLKRYDKKTNTFIPYDNTGETIRAIYEDSDGNFWLGPFFSSLRILNLQKSSNNVIPVERLKNNRVYSMFEDNTGILWIGTFSQGVFIYDKNYNHFKHYLEDPINPKSVFSIIEDRDGDTWVGTFGSGLIQFNRKQNKVITYTNNPGNPNSISSNRIMSLCQTSDGYLWIGTVNGGLYRLDKSTGIFKHYAQQGSPGSQSLSSNDITALFEDHNKRLWIGNGGGDIDCLNRTNNTFTHYDLGEKNPNTLGEQSVTTIREDKTGTIWVGSLGGGLHRYKTPLNANDNGSFEWYLNNLKTLVIQSLYFDTKGIMWVGTSRSGLIRVDPVTGTSTYITVKDGLPDNVIYGILPDKSGNLWLSTNNGLSCYNPALKKFTNYDVNDGLQSNEFNTGAYFKNSKDELFFGGVNGFNSFFPGEIKENKYIPSVFITTFKIFDNALLLPDPITDINKIELSYSQNFFSFEFVALNYTVPEKNQYAYKLDGFDKNWHFVSASQRYASYTNLDPGKYTLIIKASNNDGLWNEKGTSMIIVINPPFWMTWWFKGLTFLLFISIIIFIYYRRVLSLEKDKKLQQEISERIIEKQEEERSRIALEMHDVLGQNLLIIKNRLVLSIPHIDNKEKTLESINKVSDDVSKVLRSVRDMSHNLRPPDLDEFGLSEAIQSILISMRESTNIKVLGQIDNLDGLIPKDMEINLVRITQEAIGNIIKHSEATECRIDIKNQDNKILVEISDNGKGFELQRDKEDRNKRSGLGLIGMTERVRILGGTFNINSEVGKGTLIRIVIPAVKNEKKEVI